jgi:uncharacterized protein (DUF2141 family)
VHLCLTRSPDHFPDCTGDPDAIRRTLPANQAARIGFDIPPGAYALSAIHDENGNGRLDTSLGIPREGFGFSNNPHIWFGPPSFAAARFLLPAGGAALNVTMKYML